MVTLAAKTHSESRRGNAAGPVPAERNGRTQCRLPLSSMISMSASSVAMWALMLIAQRATFPLFRLMPEHFCQRSVNTRFHSMAEKESVECRVDSALAWWDR